MCKSRQDFSSRSRCLCVYFPNKGSHENLNEMSIEVIRCSPLSLHTVKRIKNITSSNYDFINKMLLIKKPMKTHTGIHYEYNPLKYNQFYFYKMVRYRILSWFFLLWKSFYAIQMIAWLRYYRENQPTRTTISDRFYRPFYIT